MRATDMPNGRPCALRRMNEPENPATSAPFEPGGPRPLIHGPLPGGGTIPAQNFSSVIGRLRGDLARDSKASYTSCRDPES